MKRWRSLAAALACAALLLLSGCGMDSLPQGEQMGSWDSPKKTYTVKAYLRHGNAATDFSVRCEVITTSTGESRNLYWGYRQEEAQVQWKDDHTVEINGKTLDAENDTYDWRVDGE